MTWIILISLVLAVAVFGLYFIYQSILIEKLKKNMFILHIKLRHANGVSVRGLAEDYNIDEDLIRTYIHEEYVYEEYREGKKIR